MSSPHDPYRSGYTRVTMVFTERCNNANWSKSYKKYLSFGLLIATHQHEVGITSNRESECRGEFVLEPCTHRPSHA
jgi:hypothetical protein